MLSTPPTKGWGKSPKEGWRRARENLTVRISTDDCQTWPKSRVIDPGTSGYSDLAVGQDGTIYCLYERGGDQGFALEYLTLARFNREWVSQP